jgi:NAD(P)-dependent dehydrogenase (short-subunit alcohol dehydrogenase family)
VDEIRAEGGDAHGFAADVGAKEDIHRIAGAASALAGPIDILVHNASTLGPTPLRLLLDTECEDLGQVLDVNLLGPFRLTRAIVGGMVLRGRGLVLQVTSDASVNGYPTWGAYGVSKAALDHLGRIWGAELDGTGVRVLTVGSGRDADGHARGGHARRGPGHARGSRRRRAPPGGHHPRRGSDPHGDAPGSGALDAAAPAADGGGRRLPGGAPVKTAAWPREQTEAERLLVVDPAAGKMADFAVGDLPSRLRAGDLLVVNDAATLPASLQAHATDGAPVEVRLLGPADEGQWAAAVLGAGNWRWRTEDRPAPPSLPVGSTLTFRAASDDAEPLRATVVAVSEVSPRLLRLAFDRQGDALWSGESIGAGGPCSIRTCARRSPCGTCRRRTPRARGRRRRRRRAGPSPGACCWRHGAAASPWPRSRTRRPLLDGRARARRRAPVPERFDIPEETVAAVARRGPRAGRVVAVGTTVVRALEGAADAGGGDLRAGEGRTVCASIARSVRGSWTASSPACTSRGRATSTCSRPSPPSRSCGAPSRMRSRRAISPTSSAIPA